MVRKLNENLLKGDGLFFFHDIIHFEWGTIKRLEIPLHKVNIYQYDQCLLSHSQCCFLCKNGSKTACFSEVYTHNVTKIFVSKLS